MTDKKKRTDENVVKLSDKTRELERKKRDFADPEPHQPRRGKDGQEIAPKKWPGGGRHWIANALGLPEEEDCPVQPLGFEGELKHVIDSDGQLRSWTKGDFTQQGISDLFSARPNYPKFYWPRHGKVKRTGEGEPPPTHAPIESFKADDVRDALFLAISRKGSWSPSDKLRGRGMWATKTGIVYHAGRELWTLKDGRLVVQPTGELDGYLYPHLPALPSPWTQAIAAEDNPSRILLEGFRRWNWRRPDVDPVLLLGWIGVAFLAGALDWRSAVIMLGDRETGKSTLQKVINLLFGAALFHSSDTTAAGIYQKMRNDSRPIALDELEPGADDRKIKNVVQLMRDSASGAIGRRGGSDGQSSEFQMRSAFLFSAINNPVNSAQDLSRVAALRLMPLPKETINEKPLAIDEETCGPKVLAVLMREWPRFADTLDFYKRALALGGHTNRGRDTYGTLLACADLLLGPELGDVLNIPLSQTLEGQENTNALDHWAGLLGVDLLPEVEDALPNWRKCLDWILTNPVDVWRGGKRTTVGQSIADLEHDEAARLKESDVGYSLHDCARDLAATGLGIKKAETFVVQATKEWDCSVTTAEERLGLDSAGGFVLCVPNDHPALRKLFRESDWANGSWSDALRQCPVPGVMISDKAINRVTIGGAQKRCTMIVLSKYRGAPER